jgi:hypothetical protein
MTEVTFFEDYYCFEYHTLQRAPQRFRYWLFSPVYALPPVAVSSMTDRELPQERAVYSSDFFPSRALHSSGPGIEDEFM